MSSLESNTPDAAAGGAPAYFTNGNRLFEVAGVVTNYGLAGGELTTLRDCFDGSIVAVDVDPLGMSVLSEVTPE